MALDIYNAEAGGIIYTTKGSIKFKCFVDANHNVIYIEAVGTDAESKTAWAWLPEKSITPRISFGSVAKAKDYKENPAYNLRDTIGYSLCEQKLLNKGGYATVWKSDRHNGKSIMKISVGMSATEKENPVGTAIAELKLFDSIGYTGIVQRHRNWWNSFYKKSFISLPDRRLESFYWIQMYKLASATREDKPIIDLMGPWFTSQTPWPAIWWNLNVQLTYSPIYTANHLELSKPLNKIFNDNLKNLIANVPEKWQYNAAALGRISSYDLVSPLNQKNLAGMQFEPGNLTWALYCYHQYYTHSQNEVELRTKLYPLLKRAVNYLIHLLEKDENGILHLPVSASPEYKNAVDANYSLAALRWGLEALGDINKSMNIKDQDQRRWEEILKNLVAYPIDKTGFMIGKDLPLNSSHRHYSHLMMVHPFHTVNWDQQQNRSLISKSLEHWLSYKDALAGFSFTGAASMYANIENGDKAYQWLNELFDRFMQPNTLYRETGPVMETPLAAATSIQEMLIQSWGNKIRIFPALPSQWKDVAFDNLLTEGAFLISAKREQGKTTMIKINAQKGGTCVLQTDMEIKTVMSNKRKNLKYSITSYEGKSVVNLKTMAGETVLLFPSEKLTDQHILPVKATINNNWTWGLKK
ncbi:hypothetical protein OQX61_13315 [Pedobacter sp. PLR]|uniref:glycosyl hydrolase family 95 catalytic domain-containing protein n=1 Tax=Pedobacter sp. PLR TaxID=2994465 RepID=UPI0022469FFB|nr:hypothetical protein [Pedobacter sp. PLR]MCX2452247.1 hypothetical protein [Pedobacter sp. PLR]